MISVLGARGIYKSVPHPGVAAKSRARVVQSRAPCTRKHPNIRNRRGSRRVQPRGATPRRCQRLSRPTAPRGVGGHWQVLLAAGMSKRKANSSFYNVKDDTLFWRVE